MSRDPLSDQLKAYAEELVSNLPTVQVRSPKLVEPRRKKHRGWLIGVATAASVLLMVLIPWLLATNVDDSDPVGEPQDTMTPPTAGPSTTITLPPAPAAIAPLLDADSWTVSSIGQRDPDEYFVLEVISYEEGFAALLDPGNRPLEIVTSPDGVEWTTLGTIGDEDLADLAGPASFGHIDGTWVVGSAFRWPRQNARVSDDGATWSPVNVDRMDRVRYIESTRLGLVVAGEGNTVWTTRDGHNFEPHTLEEVEWVWDVVPTSDGFLVYGGSYSYPPPPRIVWRNSDGEWQREETDLDYDSVNNTTWPYRDPIEQIPSGFIANPKQRSNEIWFSDDGLAWSKGSTAPPGWHFDEIASRDGLAFAIGDAIEGLIGSARPEPLAWATTDGMNWYGVPDNPTFFRTVSGGSWEIAVNDDRVVVIGSDRLQDQTPLRLVAWSADLE